MSGTLDADTLRKAIERYTAALVAHRDELNSLNVYPVPDGDTGTNLLLTSRAVSEALAASDGAVGADNDAASRLAAVSGTVARASLLGARGNSGVILSQVLRAFCETLAADGASDVAPSTLAAALSRAAEEAHRAVARPVEGTVLTVLRDAARGATDAAAEAASCAEVAAAALEEARCSLARTPELLPELAAAGVVDAGGKGIVLLLDALAATLRGSEATEPLGPFGPVGSSAEEPLRDTDGSAVAARAAASYEVQYLLDAPDEALARLRDTLAALGESLVVVGGGGLYSIHVHTADPGRAVEVGVEAGRPREISIVDLDRQVEGCRADEARGVRLAGPAIAVVAVADGDGIAAAFRSLGAVVVRGGPGDNPSVADLLDGIEQAGGDAVVVLPNHRNVVGAAERAAEESGRDVRIVATTSVPAGLSAATAYTATDSLDDNVDAMTEAAAAVAAGAVVTAERDATTPCGPVRRGQWLATVDGGVVAVADAARDASVALVERLQRPGAELVTLFAGGDVADAGDVAAALREAFPSLDVQVVPGGQPREPYLIGVE